LETLIVVKPDWAENADFLAELNGLIKEHKLTIIFSKKATLKEDFWKEFYVGHIGTDYFDDMIIWLSSSPSIFLVVGGEKALELVRWQIIGRKGSGLRGKYQKSELKNVAHASDSDGSAIREISLIHQWLG
jgi:nucleoside-diphosphate kinase